MPTTPSEKSRWDTLTPPLSQPVMSTIKRLGFKNMTPVQSFCIPLLMSHKDVSAEAVTGSGKTLAFLVPVVEIIRKLSPPPSKHAICALVVSPTRELAVQISQVLEAFLEGEESITQLLVIGGSGIQKDIRKFEEHGGNIIVGTPGRVDDLLSGKTNAMETAKFRAGVKNLEILVLDEADRLLSLGFSETVSSIMSKLPKQRRTGLFSATQTKDVEKLARAGLRNPVLVSVKEKEAAADKAKASSTPATLENHYLMCEPRRKLGTLVEFLRPRCKAPDAKLMVFFATCACVEYFSEVLKRLLKGVNIMAIHGKKAKRDKVFDAFRKAKSGLLMCTDVMARGIDIPDVSWVIQFDPPSNAEAFVHRCGRTARIGNRGSAVVFLLPTEDAYVNFIELNQKATLTPMDGPPADDLPDLLPQLRDWQKNDRSMFDKANRAYVSYVQAYSKHECRFIMRLKDLPFGELASSYGLLQMPRMPELKNRKITGFERDAKLDLNGIKYKDKQKEKSRQSKLKVYEETGNWPGFKKAKGNTEAWSNKTDQRKKKLERRSKKELKRKRAEAEAVENEKEEESDDDLEEDYKMLKKIKKGKMSQDAFDKQISLDDVEEEDSD